MNRYLHEKMTHLKVSISHTTVAKAQIEIKAAPHRAVSVLMREMKKTSY